jgi:hypothetical protein
MNKNKLNTHSNKPHNIFLLNTPCGRLSICLIHRDGNSLLVFEVSDFFAYLYTFTLLRSKCKWCLTNPQMVTLA